MKRNGLVFVPPETPKRVILYPTQESASQQQSLNGQQNRARTALVTNTHNESPHSATNNARLTRQQTISVPSNGSAKPSLSNNHDEVTPLANGQQSTMNAAQKVQNPYFANPFFRPKMVTNQPAASSNGLTTSGPTRESSVVTTTIPFQTSTTSSMTNANSNRAKLSMYPQPMNAPAPINSRLTDSETTGLTTTSSSSNQDDPRRWAQTVGPASIARRALNDERPNGVLNLSSANATTTISTDSPKMKRTSATDLVISLMDPLRPPLKTNASSAVNVFTRNIHARDDSTLPGPTSGNGETASVPTTASTLAGSSAANNNNQNWRKTLLANFQKNSRNMPTAKIFQSRHAAAPVPVVNPDVPASQPVKPERTNILSGTINERAFQVSDTAPPIPFFMRKSAESLRLNRQENSSNNNNNVERSSSLQVSPTAFSSSPAATNHPTTTASPPVSQSDEAVKNKEASNGESNLHVPIPIPSALISTKPSVSAEQQRAIITRVMIRRDFVKSTEVKPPMPTAGNARLLIPPQSAKPGGLPTNNAAQATANNDPSNMSHMHTNGNHMYQSAQPGQPLSQKSLLSFNALNPAMRTDPHGQQTPQKQQQQQQQYTNGTSHSGTSSIPMTKGSPSQSGNNTPAPFRSNSLSAANAESRRKKEELFNNKAKKRAASASAPSTDE